MVATRSSSLRQRGSAFEVAVWAICALVTGSVAITMFPFMFVGLMSFVLLPLVFLSWSRTIHLSAPAREGGHRGQIVIALLIGTVLVTIVLSRMATDIFGPRGFRD